ncbi:ABC transporter ATP-binding protein [Planctomycetaceae bacterium SCGC AG-212-F19]|nr:ABC transporter ATP-binding protein [Planctomycetaceae bacterium SCGC AG-212-F19]
MLANDFVLQGQSLHVTYGTGKMATDALCDVSLELHAGELAVLMGPSGSGKTSLLAVLAGLLAPNAGNVTSLGQDLWEMSERDREAFRLEHYGFIFQGYNLFPALTARQQLEMILCWGTGLTIREARTPVEEMLELLGLGAKQDLLPGQLSGGEKQRVAIGRALIKEPTFCFADEPTSALDWERGQQVIELMRLAAHERGTTVLVVSHDPRTLPYADRVLHLNDGCLSESPPVLDENEEVWR